jgi:hypothetical protein
MRENDAAKGPVEGRRGRRRLQKNRIEDWPKTGIGIAKGEISESKQLTVGPDCSNKHPLLNND